MTSLIQGGISWCFVSLLTVAAITARVPSVIAEENVALEAHFRRDRARRTKVILEVKGKLQLNPDGQQITQLPLQVRGELEYYERVIDVDPGQRIRRTARHYARAEAAIQLDTSTRAVQLRDSRRLVGLATTDTGGELYAPGGPLTRDELELIDVLGNSALLERLLPEGMVARGASWTHDHALLAALLSLDAIHQHDCQSTLREIRDELAIIDLKGTVAGAAGGVNSDIKLSGVYNFDLRQQRITWLAMSIEEERAVGHAEPGFAVTARLRLASQEAPLPKELDDDGLADWDLTPSDGRRLLSLPSSGGFDLLHPRQWRVMVDRRDVTVLRLVERGELLAQCNVSVLPPVAAGQQLTLESFEADVERALGDNFGQILESSQEMNEGGIRVLRAAASGAVAEIPIQWVYYHLSSADGQQAAVVFTLEADLIERLAGTDQTLVSSFRFHPAASTPRPAPDGVPVGAHDAGGRALSDRE